LIIRPAEATGEIDDAWSFGPQVKSHAGLGHDATQTLIVQPAGEAARQFSQRIFQFMIAGTASKVARPIMDFGLHFVMSSRSLERDLDEKIAQLLTQPKSAAKPRHQLFTMRGLEQNVTGVELKHQSLLSEGTAKMIVSPVSKGRQLQQEYYPARGNETRVKSGQLTV
jgi:hypothetical protein